MSRHTFGIFNDEGLVEGDFSTDHDADDAICARYPDCAKDLWVSICCPEHPENERDNCEECNSDDET